MKEFSGLFMKYREVTAPRTQAARRVFGALIVLALAAAGIADADTALLKDGREIKGLVVEEHEDRVVFSTADGEIRLKRTLIADLQFDDPAYTFLSLGRERERQEKFGEALSYYEKAYQLNPNLEDAKSAALGIRSRFWANFGQGPVSEVAKQQAIENAYRSDQTLEEQMKAREDDLGKEVWTRMGMELTVIGDWMTVTKVKLGSQAQRKVLKPGDRVLAIDGTSMKYLNKAAVGEKLLEPRFTSLKAGIGRAVSIPAGESRKLKDLGFKMSQAYDGIVVTEVRAGSASDRLGFKAGDQIDKINGTMTRYLPLGKAVESIEKSDVKKPLRVDLEKTLILDRK